MNEGAKFTVINGFAVGFARVGILLSGSVGPKATTPEVIIGVRVLSLKLRI